jgi:hypothetical protein
VGGKINDYSELMMMDKFLPGLIGLFDDCCLLIMDDLTGNRDDIELETSLVSIASTDAPPG